MKDKDEKFIPTDNRIIEQNIEYYIGLTTSPGYALFINGPWGSGKTFLVKNFFKKKKIKDFIHISFYGLASPQEFEDQFFKSLHPFMSNKALLITGGLAKTILGKFGMSSDGVDFKKFLPDTTDKLIIFDDLERCLAIPQALGFINRFIEHYGNKVIVLGDISKIDKELFKEQKEKTIGNTFTITPEFKITFDDLIGADTDNELTNIFKLNYPIIRSCFNRNECKNLRTLKFCVMEFQRFYDQLPQEAKIHKGFLATAIDTFFSICLELRSGNLDVNQISDLPNAYSIKSWSTRNNDTEEESPLNIIRVRHFGDKLTIEPNLSLLQAFFEFGVVDPELMSESIGNSSFFYKDTSPSWVKLWHAYSLTESDYKDYLDSTLKDFKGYKFVEIGELRHIIGILLDYSEKRLIPDLNKDQAVDLCTEVLRHIEDNNLIHIPFKEKDFPSSFDDEYSNGLQFHSFRSEIFKKFSDQIKEMAKKKRDDSYLEIVKKIPEEMKKNPDELWSILTSGRQNYEKYPPLYRHPVLQYVDVDEFLSALIEMNPANTARFSVMAVLKDRYQHQSVELAKDLPWLRELQRKMEEKIPTMGQPTKYQFEALKGNLDNIIKNAEEWSKQLNAHNQSQSSVNN